MSSRHSTAVCLSFVVLLTTTTRTQNYTRISRTDAFHGFFPCLNVTSQSEAQRCDLFVYPAVLLAVQKLNSDFDGERVFDLSAGMTVKGSSNVEILYSLFADINEELDAPRGILPLLRANIGPGNDYTSTRLYVPIAADFGVPQVSYGLSDDRLDKQPNFYRTVPSIPVINRALIKLLSHFEWFHIGILASREEQYRHQMESFARYFKQYTERQDRDDLSYQGSTDNITASLADLRRQDIRIIVGFFSSRAARMILCEASSPQFNLTTSDHVWILPSYYDPDWWKVGGASNHNDKLNNCSDQEMVDILNSLIFVDPVKYPPLDTSLPEFYSELLNKTRELYSDLDPDVRLEPLLQHSRAVSAYDSTLLLGRSLRNKTIDIGALQTNVLCELCRIYSDCFLPAEDLEICELVFPNCPLLSNDSISIHPSSLLPDEFVPDYRSRLLAGYGQVLLTQFVDGTHCPMILYWPTESETPEALKNNFVSVYSLSNQTCARDLGLDAETIFFNTAACPQDFFWKGRTSPPTSNDIFASEIPVWSLALVGVFVTLAEVFIIFLICFQIIWRNNAYVKSSSPRINVLMLLGLMVSMPYPLTTGIILSNTRYEIDETFLTIVCQGDHWIILTGETLFVAAVFVKNWRLYKIFHNKRLKVKLHNLRDRDLMIAAIVLAVPVLVMLVIWNAISLYKYTRVCIENDDLQLFVLTICTTEEALVEKVCLYLVVGYQLVLLVAAVWMSAMIDEAPHSIRLDVRAMRAGFALGLSMTIVFLIADTIILDFNVLDYGLYWLFIDLQYVGQVLLVGILFFYQVVLVFRDYRRKVKQKPNPKESEVEKYHASLLLEITELTESLAEKEATIKRIKAERENKDSSRINQENSQSTAP